MLVTIGVGGCGDPSPRTEPAESGQAPDPIGEATIVAAGDILVPGDGPTGLTARLVQREGPAGPITGGADAHLFSDASGHRVVVLYEQGSETGPSLDSIAGADDSVGDSRAAVIEVAGGWWVRWYPDDGSQEPPSAVVFAEGVDEQRARAIADAVRWDADAATIGVTDPEGLGLVDIAHAPGLSIADLGDPRPPFGATGVLWVPEGGGLFDGPSLTVSTWKQDPAVSAILRAVVDGDVSEVRGVPGAGGALLRPGDDERLVRTWEEQGMTVLAVTSGLAPGDVDDIVGALRPATDEDWRRLNDEATVAPPLDTPGIQGRFATGYWSFTVEGPDPTKLMVSVSVMLTDGDFAGHSGGPFDSPLSVDVTHVGDGTLVAGLVDPETASVVLTLADGTTVAPELTRLEAAGGVQVFGQWTDGVVDVARASSFDRSGTERARGEAGMLAAGPNSYSFSGTLLG